MTDILTIGDTKMDVFIDLGKKARIACDIDRPRCMLSMKFGEKIPVDSAVSMVAGSAVNVAIGGRRLGLKTAAMSVTGDDGTAMLAKELLRRERVETTFLKKEDGTKSSFSAVLNFEGESTILAVHEPHTYILPRRLGCRFVFVSELGISYEPLFRELARRAKKGEFRLGVNPGAVQLEKLHPSLYTLLRAADVLVVNAAEAQRLALHETDHVPSLLHKLQSLGPRTVLVTDGARGAYGVSNGEILFAPAARAKRVETTGAGDAFTSGFLAGYLRGLGLAKSMTYGIFNSASVVEHVGPQAGLLSRARLSKRITASPSYTPTSV
ncbi:carbohydrate kinase family protein [Candidatus Uhrbacteria bacterium]|nr:carbohydrate kinase family protein [Candidatus Uhrbacteria bacterium]